ncbi:MAG: N-acetyltransferase [Anaerolineales bacterium]|nr:N-acetyltransferase [Anaerolineales bacterium]
MLTIRLATPTDLPAIVALHNQAIAAGNTNAYTEPFTVAERRDWFAAHAPDAHPIYVCANEAGSLLGWLSVSPYRGRPALKRTAEVSYYVDYACHGQGIGSTLMKHAIADASWLGKKVFIAIVLDTNAASSRLLEKFGFELWGTLPEVAEFAGHTCGHLYYGRRVG